MVDKKLLSLHFRYVNINWIAETPAFFAGNLYPNEKSDCPTYQRYTKGLVTIGAGNEKYDSHTNRIGMLIINKASGSQRPSSIMFLLRPDYRLKKPTCKPHAKKLNEQDR